MIAKLAASFYADEVLSSREGLFKLFIMRIFLEKKLKFLVQGIESSQVLTINRFDA